MRDVHRCHTIGFLVSVQGWVTHRVSKSKGTVYVRCDRCRPHRCAVPSARCDCAPEEPGLVIWLQRVGRQQLRDHQLDGLLGVTYFGISMAASLAGVALAELLLAACPCAHALMALRCRSALGGAAASKAVLLLLRLPAPRDADGLQLLSPWAALTRLRTRCRLAAGLLRAVPYSR